MVVAAADRRRAGGPITFRCGLDNRPEHFGIPERKSVYLEELPFYENDEIPIFVVVLLVTDRCRFRIFALNDRRPGALRFRDDRFGGTV